MQVRRAEAILLIHLSGLPAGMAIPARGQTQHGKVFICMLHEAIALKLPECR